ncbi:hypothetical protein [Neptunicoccus sediminis]|uniref:hypothetical protein n=1 Tax=Neptunicoccus sediminis TaxID=1892596 RepID=UPI00084624B3|nr:hypothetical protein [Neptunicoccus sediminis]
MLSARAIAVCLLSVASLPAAAQESSEQTRVVACLSGMEQGQTSWPECRSLLFHPCETFPVGGEDHLTCLAEQKADWRAHLDATTLTLNARLTAEGSGQLTDLLGQWFGYVGNKCNGVAQEKADISADAARLGCEISEFAGLSTEFDSCLQGKSLSPYCIVQE